MRNIFKKSASDRVKQKHLSISCTKEKRTIIKYAVFAILFVIAATLFGVNIWCSLAGGLLMMAIFTFRVELDDSTPVYVRFIFMAVITIIEFILMQVTISCGVLLIGPIKFIMNLLLLVGVSSVLWLVSGRIKFSCLTVLTLCTIIGVADHLVVQARSFEIQFSDFASLGTAMEVAGGYSFELSQMTMAGVLFNVCLITFILRSRLPKKGNHMQRAIISCSSIVISVICFAIIYSQIGASVIGYQDKYWKYRGSERNGFLVNMIYSASATRVIAPEGYDKGNLKNEIKSSVDEVNAAKASAEGDTEKKKPNVIVVMNESFSDIQNIVADYTENQMLTSIEVTPFLDSLSDSAPNIIKGRAYSSVYGGNTANSELEFLMQMSMQFIPRNTVAYNLYLEENNVSSIIDLFKANGYKTIGMHPENCTNWRRNLIYSYYGFDETYFIDSFDNLSEEDYYRGHVSDSAVYKKVESIYEQKEEDEPLFAFVVTMQNHGGYVGAEFEPEDYTVNIEGYENYMSVREYLSSIHNSDESLKSLIEYFSNTDEETVIVFYGDHQPSLSSVSSKFYGLNDDSTTEELQKKYLVPYFFWANFDIDCDRATSITSLNYVSSWLLDIVGVEDTPFTKFVEKTNEEMLAINSMGWIDRNGVFHESDYVNRHYNDIMKTYSHLQYNAIFDVKNRKDNLFTVNK